MDLECKFDVQDDILPFILSRRDDALRKDHPDADITVQLLGQERNGTLLYVWDDFVPIGSSHVEVTHIGMYHTVEQMSKCLFVHDCKISVVSCSINQEGSMLAYVVKETRASSERPGDAASSTPSANGKEEQEVYRAFLAEIKPQHAIFDLNVERASLLHVQFLWPWSGQGLVDGTSSGPKECRLLVFLHRESIGLYRVPIARIGNDRVVMSGPPDAQPVLSRFLWAQWDAPAQRLFVVLQRSRAPAPSDQEIIPVFRCLEVTGQGSQISLTKMMEMDLPPDIKLPSSRYSYELPSLKNTTSDKSINMYVISQPGGSMCLCYQLPPKRLANSRPSSRRHSKASLSQRSREVTPIPRRPDSLNLEDEAARTVQSRLGDGASSAMSKANAAMSPMTPLAPDSSSLGVATSPSSPMSDLSLSLSLDVSADVTRTRTRGQANWPGSRTHQSNTGQTSSLKINLDDTHTGAARLKRTLSEVLEVHYTVVVLHHKTVLQCSIPQVQRSVAKRMQLFFAPLNGYIMVYYPGTVLHLLNVNPEVEPCLHLAFEMQDVPWITLPGGLQQEKGMKEEKEKEMGEDTRRRSSSEPGGGHENWVVDQIRTHRPVFTHFLRDRTASKYDDLLFDGLSGCCYQPVISKGLIPQLLVRDGAVPFKLGLLHLAVVTLKDVTLNRKIIENLTQDPFQLEIQDLLAEFLLGGTFCFIRLKLEKHILRYLPFTKIDTSKTVVIETLAGSRLACIKANDLGNRYVPKLFLAKKGRRDKRQGSDASSHMWEALDKQLRKNLERRDAPLKRFDTRSLMLKLKDEEQASKAVKNEEKASKPAQPQSERLSLLKKVAAFSKRALSPSKEQRQAGQKDPVGAVSMEDDYQRSSGIDEDQNKHIEMTLDDLVSFLRSRMPFHNHDRLVSYASEFVSCQMQQVKHMISLFSSANGFTENMDQLAHIPLNQEASDEELTLFYMVERLYSAALSLCFPLPVGFKPFFVSLGYRCLDVNMFLQYVDQGIFEITESFLTRMVKEVSDESKANVDLKMKLIHQLSKASAERVLLAWDHPSSRMIVARRYASSCFHDNAEMSPRTGSSSAVAQSNPQKNRKKSMGAAMPGREADETYMDAIPDFPPLNYFLKFLEAADPSWQLPSRSRSEIREKVDYSFVGRIALQSSVREHGQDLGGMAF